MQGLTPVEQTAVYSVLGIAVLGLLYAVFLRAQTLREPKGTPRMLEVWNAIRQGADTYLRRQLRSILPLIIVLTAAPFLSVYLVPPSPEALERFPGLSPDGGRLAIGGGRAVAFCMGASFCVPGGR